MKKLGRFSILLVLYVVLYAVAYSVIPALVALFGGSFLEVAQAPMYIMFAGIMIAVGLGVVFNDSFDSDFCSKD